MNNKELKEVLMLHTKWLKDEPDGSKADLSEVDLSEANLREIDLRGANLRNADLSGADLSWADLSGAYLSEANLREANLSCCIGVPALICPEEGSYYGFKKADDHIVVLKILYTAKRSSATSRKCRASEAEVIRIENLDGSISDIKRVRSNYDNTFEYEVGKIVKVDNFDPDRWKECAPGIHHFITRQEAIDYTI